MSKRVFADFSKTTLTLSKKFPTQSLLNMTWYQNLNMFKKSWGMRLWITTSTFNVLVSKAYSYSHVRIFLNSFQTINWNSLTTLSDIRRFYVMFYYNNGFYVMFYYNNVKVGSTLYGRSTPKDWFPLFCRMM